MIVKATVGKCPITNPWFVVQRIKSFQEAFDNSEGFFRDERVVDADGFWRVRSREGVYCGGDGLPSQPHLVYVENGKVLGFIYFNEVDYPAWCNEKKGQYCVVVHPRHRRRGIGTKLVEAGRREWGFDFGKQQYTRAGAALVRSFLNKEQP